MTDVLEIEIAKIETGYLIEVHTYGERMNFAYPTIEATLAKVKEVLEKKQ